MGQRCSMRRRIWCQLTGQLQVESPNAGSPLWQPQSRQAIFSLYGLCFTTSVLQPTLYSFCSTIPSLLPVRQTRNKCGTLNSPLSSPSLLRGINFFNFFIYSIRHIRPQQGGQDEAAEVRWIQETVKLIWRCPGSMYRNAVNKLTRQAQPHSSSTPAQPLQRHLPSFTTSPNPFPTAPSVAYNTDIDSWVRLWARQYGVWYEAYEGEGVVTRGHIGRGRIHMASLLP